MTPDDGGAGGWSRRPARQELEDHKIKKKLIDINDH